MGLREAVDDVATDHGLQVAFAVVLLVLSVVLILTRTNVVQILLASVVASYALARLYVLVVR